MRSVEVYSRVYCPAYHCKGTVLAMMPVRRGIARTFEVRLDSGVDVWLELDEVEAADDDDDIPTLPFRASRDVGPAAETRQPQPTNHRSPPRGQPYPLEAGPSPAKPALFASWQAQLEADGW